MRQWHAPGSRDVMVKHIVGNQQPSPSHCAHAKLDDMTTIPVELRASQGWFCLLTLATFSVACSDDGGVHRYESQDEDALCMNTTPGSPSVVTVTTWSGCWSGSCDQVVRHECSIEVEGTRLVVHSATVVDSQQGGSCTSDCKMVAAECQSEAVPGGTYEVVYGEQTASVTLPREDSFDVFHEGTPQAEARCLE